MKIVPGIEEEYIAFMKQKEQDALRKRKITEALKPGTWVRYFKRPETFSKIRGSTLSEPVQIIQQHKYSYATGKNTRLGAIKNTTTSNSYEVTSTTQRLGAIKNTTTSNSYEVTSTTQRFMPYKLVVALNQSYCD